MSGGSYDYLHRHIEDLAGEVRDRTTDPKRLAFADLLDLCAKAAHDIEWVDSYDYSPGDEMPAIEAALNFNAADAVTSALLLDLEGAMRRAAEHLKAITPTPAALCSVCGNPAQPSLTINLLPVCTNCVRTGKARNKEKA